MHPSAAIDASSSQADMRLPLEEGDPAADGRMFRRCLGQYGTGIAIITTAVEDRRAAVTVNSFASVSLEPPLVLWSIAHASRSHSLFRTSGRFAVNILSSRQMEVSRHFSSKVEDKFADAAWSSGPFGSPLIAGCLAHFECETHAQVEGGDHTILIGLVKRARRFDGEPLLFSQGHYSVADSHPDASPTPETSGTKLDTTAEGTIVSQIFEAHNLLSTTFDEHRRAEGVHLSVARVLACLYDRPGLRTDQLAAATLLGQRDTEDAISELLARGLLVSFESGFSLTDAGRHLREAVRSRWVAFQHAQIAGIPEADLRSTIRTLSKLIDKNRIAD
ncbi:flavin reductase [Labrys wisconsinensis]|uniref:Flavin reductase (DIM6/NTAB) family NADH-FMN oxidoreductase RutF/DNA-binding MarR family transcriptional regulator n=1 Tax=Labrys wisconsinensis TaxID=425677 RepID=A0ABU0JJ74_9HYPH|nr:flavin reductase [Labrys wisconsinensis]MDQ0474341.1 flavin reductase (DIM6/NTAB) family NADH-FMN oxidoreductase RutF/DNA-binding MarR family transcriptional regulator [Labrys wisconsinensis]